MYPQTAPQPQKSNWPKYVAFGCLGLLVVLVAGGVLAYYGIRSAVSGLVAEYSSEDPIAVPEVQMSNEEIWALRGRIRDFGDHIDQGVPAEPLVLTQEEINALIQDAMDKKGRNGRLYVRIVGRQLEGDVSIPLGEISDDFAGRYLNGKARISAGVVGDRLVAHLEDVKIGDKYVPDQIRERISRENLLKDAYDDPEARQYLTRLDSIEIGDGKLVLRPRSSP